MAKNKANIISGAGNLWIADTTTSLPTINSSTGALTMTGWTELGYTEGIEITPNVAHQMITVDGYLTPIKAINTEELAEIKVSFSERDLGTLKLGLSTATYATQAADASSVGLEVIHMGGGTVAEKSLLFVGKSPEGYARMFHFYSVVPDGEVTYNASNEHAPYEVTFQCLANTSNEAGERLFSMYDVTSLQTS